jgi:phage pi2 protein 07
MPNYAPNLKWRFDKKSAQLGFGDTLKQKIKEALKSTDPTTGKLLMEDLVNLPNNTNALNIKKEFYEFDIITNTWTFNPKKVDLFIELNFKAIFEF